MNYRDALSDQINEIDRSIAAEKSVMSSILNRAKNPNSSGGSALSETNARVFDAADKAVESLENRRKELADQVHRENVASAQNSQWGLSRGVGGATIGRESGPYRPDGAHSFFADLFRAKIRGDDRATERLQRNARHVEAYSTRTGLTTVNGAGGEYVPPLWLVDDFVAYARPGRPVADLCTRGELPSGTDSINLPKISTGSAVAFQGTQNTGINETDLTTSSVSSGVYTVAGGQTIAVQLVDQSPVSGSFDRVIMADLSADHARFIDYSVVLNGSGSNQPTGVLNLSGTTTLTWTTGSPTSGGFVSAVADAAQKVQTLRYLPPTHIVMHPRRWAWLVAQTDSQGRPLVVPGVGNQAVNAYGAMADGNPAQGYVGSLLGFPVVVDAQIPTTLGSGTNQDCVIIAKWDDLYLWESQIQADVFPQTYAANASLYARIYNYVSFQPARYPQSICTIGGTGLVAPSFAA
jgi:HK97 family phage major capsid protein